MKRSILTVALMAATLAGCQEAQQTKAQEPALTNNQINDLFQAELAVAEKFTCKDLAERAKVNSARFDNDFGPNGVFVVQNARVESISTAIWGDHIVVSTKATDQMFELGSCDLNFDSSESDVDRALALNVGDRMSFICLNGSAKAIQGTGVSLNACQTLPSYKGTWRKFFINDKAFRSAMIEKHGL